MFHFGTVALERLSKCCCIMELGSLHMLDSALRLLYPNVGGVPCRIRFVQH
jgi:hypothetical protein